MESPYSRVVTTRASMAIEKSLVLAAAPTIPMSHYYFAPGTDLQPVQCLTRYAIVYRHQRKPEVPGTENSSSSMLCQQPLFLRQLHA
jgi:hypothetical protein